ncbi:MAG TPA: 3,4-dihydroxy-2-butanone-4-phosphate synthase [Thermoplasmata archaeon]|nr:3,4-dihydroxy-2-butanone-4-phosphate synthase [Thermoplasmata archaeon]HIH28925.1 3,4-dihydroxy-2-butanone-4-phosphate synthase [Thermoplasmata archaeon]
MTVQEAINSLQKGQFILIYDNESRESETDLVIASQFVTPESIKRMRKDGGGLIFLMMSYPAAQTLQLPFLSDLFSQVSNEYPVLTALVPNDIPYDTKSSFSLYINHRTTFTGITDNDRSLTMKKFAELVKRIKDKDSKKAIKELGQEFRSPGHIPICIASEKLLNERKGHTELVISLLQMAGLTLVGSGCEIMGEHGKALPKEDAKRYAEKNNLVFLEGNDIIKAWKQWSK